ncbi:MAG: hypothetical protein J6U98_03390 [Abditibacteriota bacterium]|nr:hypothetical protein [Abditibacteriota bacterium]
MRFIKSFVLISLLTFLAVASFAQQPDVLVLIAYGSRMGQVAVSYTGVVPEAQVTKDIQNIALSRDWKIADATVNTESVDDKSAPTTSATFYTADAIDPETGVVELEPIIESLKRFKNMQIICVGMPADLEYMGVTDFENKYVKVESSISQGTYRYTVTVKDKGFDKLKLPRKKVDVLPEGEVPAEPEKSSAGRTILIIASALLAAMAVYFLALLATKKKK